MVGDDGEERLVAPSMQEWGEHTRKDSGSHLQLKDVGVTTPFRTVPDEG